MAKYNIVTIGDIHWGAMDPDEMYLHLQYVLDFIRMMKDEIDLVVINGDYFDYRLTLNSKPALKALRWFDELYTTCLASGVQKIRAIKGTKEHDNDQWEAIHPKEQGDFFKKFYENTVEETLHGLSCIYCPDETINVSDYQEIYLKNMMSSCNIGFFHGNFDIVLPKMVIEQNKESKIPSIIFEKSVWEKLINGPMIASHWHTFTDADPLLYIGSYDRWSFGEEDNKGFLFVQYDTDTQSYFWKRIINPFARRFETILVDNSIIKTPDDFSILRESILEMKAIDSDMKIRVKYQISEDNIESIANFNEFKNLISNMRGVKAEIKDLIKKAKRKKEKEEIDVSSERYSYILSTVTPMNEKIQEYLLREKNVELPLDVIDSYIGKYLKSE